MKTNTLVLYFATLCGSIVSCRFIKPPPDYCPDVFEYRTRRSDLYKYGVVTIDHPPPLGTTLDLVVRISIEGRLFKNQFEGRLELLQTRQKTILQIRDRLPVQYALHFPIQSPLPYVKRITFNDRIICQVQSEHDSIWLSIKNGVRAFICLYSKGFSGIDMDTFITEVRLHHTLYTALANQIYGTNMEPSSVPSKPNKGLIHMEIPFHVHIPPPATTTISTTSSEIPMVEPIKMPIVEIQNKSQLRSICGRTHKSYQKSPLHFGGFTIQRGSWPWLAAVYTVKPTGVAFTCAGNLISARAVISAAHCFHTIGRDFKPNEVLVALGKYDMTKWIEDGAQLMEVSDINVHEDYKQSEASFDADVSVIMLRKPVSFTEFIRPICLWEESNRLSDVVDSIGTVVGWGSDGQGQTVTQTPRSINIPIVSEVECLRSSATFGAITASRSFCAGRKDGFGPCHGDSGSGLAILRGGQMVLRGIVSAALSGPMSTCDLSNYVVFTDVAKFVPWIRLFL